MSQGKQIANKASLDLRLQGFASRVTFAEARKWMRSYSSPLCCEEVELGVAVGRVTAKSLVAAGDFPKLDCAARDGYALRSDETFGASNYNPLSFTLDSERPSAAGPHARLVSAGSPLPEEADAVLPFEYAERSGSGIQVSVPVAPGAGVCRRGEEVRDGITVVEANRPLQPADIGLLALFGTERVHVVRRPKVALVIAAASTKETSSGNDATGPMLAALIARDGGMVDTRRHVTSEVDALASTFRSADANVILSVGRTGTGPDDIAPLALAAAGELDIHGIAMQPGGSAGLGHVGERPVFLLPGNPQAAFCAYELLAGRLIRSLGGRDSALPYPVEQVELGAKIVSEIGQFDLCLVRMIDGLAFPVASTDSGSLASFIGAHGFILVPSSLEGYSAGTRVCVHQLSDQPRKFACGKDDDDVL